MKICIATSLLRTNRHFVLQVSSKVALKIAMPMSIVSVNQEKETSSFHSLLDMEDVVWNEKCQILLNWLHSDCERNHTEEDDTLATIQNQILRGQKYPTTRSKCWKHIVIELESLPFGIQQQLLLLDKRFGSNFQSTKSQNMFKSPMRGKLRPGKFLENENLSKENSSISSYHSTFIDGEQTKETIKVEDPQNKDNEDIQSKGSTEYSNKEDEKQDLSRSQDRQEVKKNELSMMERQELWLKKKKEKVEAEKLRQQEEEDKELTFKPHILKKQLSFNSSSSINMNRNLTLTNPNTTVKVMENNNNNYNTVKMMEYNKAEGKKDSTRLPIRFRLTSKESTSKEDLKENNDPKDRNLQPYRNKDMIKKVKLGLKGGRSKSSSKLILRHKKNERFGTLNKSELRQTSSDQESSSLSCGDRDEDETQYLFVVPSNPITEQEETFTQHVQLENLEKRTVETCPALLNKKNENDSLKNEMEISVVVSDPRIPEFKFDKGSTEFKGCFRLHNPSLYELNSMYRKKDKYSGCEGISLLMGKNEATHIEEIVAILFDRVRFTEEQAGQWWKMNHHRFHYSII